jgi:hypothetical protein
MLDTLQCEHDLLAASQSGAPPYDYNNCNYVVGKKSKHLEIIIANMKDTHYLAGNLSEWDTPLVWFCKQAQLSETFCKDFDGDFHSEEYKSDFDDTVEVNYYGKHIAYRQLIRDLPR